MGQPKRKDKPTQEEAASTASEPGARADFTPWKKPAGMTRRGWAILGGLLLVMQVPLLQRAFRGPARTVATVPYKDAFDDRNALKANYWSSGGLWRLVNGELSSPGVKNNPLWLLAKLPRDVAVEFDVRSDSPEGDIKVEIFGDGYDHASGYILIHGGWSNTLSIIARLDEHGPTSRELERRRITQSPKTRMRVEASPFPVEVGRKYHWRIERRGKTLTWQIDGQPFMSFEDPYPLEGEGHDRFGFSSWEAQLTFDNLVIQPL
jgi:hypothetical protein